MSNVDLAGRAEHHLKSRSRNSKRSIAWGRILLPTGELASEQLMPKNFPFYNPEHHRQLYALLEQKQPAAIIAATRNNPESAGALYPFPLIIDGDFHIPCAHCSEETGERIASSPARTFHLVIDSERRDSSASNVICRLNPHTSRKILVTAHIDAYEDTPGATDNAAGTVVLLLLAEVKKSAETVFGNYPGLIEGSQWLAGDHPVFLQRGVPAIAVTTERVEQLVECIAHTPKDSPENVDCAKLVELAEALVHFLKEIG